MKNILAALILSAAANTAIAIDTPYNHAHVVDYKDTLEASKSAFVDVIIFSIDALTKKVTFIGADSVIRTHRYTEGSRIENLSEGDKVQIKLEARETYSMR